VGDAESLGAGTGVSVGVGVAVSVGVGVAVSVGGGVAVSVGAGVVDGAGLGVVTGGFVVDPCSVPEPVPGVAPEPDVEPDAVLPDVQVTELPSAERTHTICDPVLDAEVVGFGVGVDEAWGAGCVVTVRADDPAGDVAPRRIVTGCVPAAGGSTTCTVLTVLRRTADFVPGCVCCVLEATGANRGQAGTLCVTGTAGAGVEVAPDETANAGE
jgi:hypothetical protein